MEHEILTLNNTNTNRMLAQVDRYADARCHPGILLISITDRHGDKAIRLSSNGLIASKVAQYIDNDRNNSITSKFFARLSSTSRSYFDGKLK